MTYDFASRDYPLKMELFLTDATDPIFYFFNMIFSEFMP